MANDTVKLELRGDIQIDVFADAIRHFSELVLALSHEIAGRDLIEWELDTLDYGSPAVLMWQGHLDDIETVESVVVAVETVGKSLERGDAIPYGEQIRNIAVNLAKIPNGKIDTLLLGSSKTVASITSDAASNLENNIQPSEVSSYGQVVGTADTISRRQGYVVTIFDELFDKAVRCYFEQGQENLMRDMWEKRVSVTGLIARDAYSGRPRAIRHISNVEFLPKSSLDNFIALKGSASYKPGDELPEETIRRFRDAS